MGGSLMCNCVSIIFPYSGYEDSEVKNRLLQVIEKSLPPDSSTSSELHTDRVNKKPVLVVNEDTMTDLGGEEGLKTYLTDADPNLLDKLRLVKAWAVDSCQLWLHGFGRIIDDYRANFADYKEAGITKDEISVLQIPGDLKYVNNFPTFLNRLIDMVTSVEAQYDLVLGDYDVERQTSKELIDQYGTYPLLFNWFPEIAQRLLREDIGLGIQKPRTEFLAAKISFLEEMMSHKDRKKFAYEETLALLIHALNDNLNPNQRPRRNIGTRPWMIHKVDLGLLGDVAAGRGLRSAVDQVERTERLLKFLWRDLNGKDAFNLSDFDRLDRNSTAIREAAIISFSNFLT